MSWSSAATPSSVSSSSGQAQLSAERQRVDHHVHGVEELPLPLRADGGQAQHRGLVLEEPSQHDADHRRRLAHVRRVAGGDLTRDVAQLAEHAVIERAIGLAPAVAAFAVSDGGAGDRGNVDGASSARVRARPPGPDRSQAAG